MNEIFENLYDMTAFSNIIAEPQFLIMYAIAFVLLYLGTDDHFLHWDLAGAGRAVLPVWLGIPLGYHRSVVGHCAGSDSENCLQRDFLLEKAGLPHGADAAASSRGKSTSTSIENTV